MDYCLITVMGMTNECQNGIIRTRKQKPCSNGLTRHHIEQFSEQEYAQFKSRMKEYASNFNFTFYEEEDSDGMVWFETTYDCDPAFRLRLGAWIVGYIMALGFDVDGNRHKS